MLPSLSTGDINHRITNVIKVCEYGLLQINLSLLHLRTRKPSRLQRGSLYQCPFIPFSKIDLQLILKLKLNHRHIAIFHLRVVMKQSHKAVCLIAIHYGEYGSCLRFHKIMALSCWLANYWGDISSLIYQPLSI